MGRSHEKLRNNLEELRKSAGLTQQELSESAEVSRKSINAIENGVYIPSTNGSLPLPSPFYSQSGTFKGDNNKYILSNDK